MKTLISFSAVLWLVIGLSLDASAAETVSALVQTQSLVRHNLSKTISSYGTVDVDPLNMESINFPRAGRVTRLLVSQGEEVSKDAPLLQVREPSTESANYEQARTSVDLAKSRADPCAEPAGAATGDQIAARSSAESTIRRRDWAFCSAENGNRDSKPGGYCAF